jgi:hypothetical protein
MNLCEPFGYSSRNGKTIHCGQVNMVFFCSDIILKLSTKGVGNFILFALLILYSVIELQQFEHELMLYALQ